jgi:TPP-dependent trihydroxycyclohexane-1,2-dione (THcHDO) dehydratase
VVIVAKAEKRNRSIGADVWWDVGVARTSSMPETQAASAAFAAGRKHQRALV